MARLSAAAIAASIRSSFAALGAVDGTLYLIARALDRVGGGRLRLLKYRFVAQPIPSGGPGGSDAKSSFHIVQIDPGDPLIASFPRPASVNERRFSDGAICFAATRNGKFVGHIWIARVRYEEDEVRCTYLLLPPERAVWDFDVYVEPEFRFGKAFARLWDATNEALARGGFRWTLSRISAFNAGSLAAHRRLGAVPLSSAAFLCIGGFQLAFFTCPPYVHLSAGTAKRPSLRLQAPVRDTNDGPLTSGRNVRPTQQ